VAGAGFLGGCAEGLEVAASGAFLPAVSKGIGVGVVGRGVALFSVAISSVRVSISSTSESMADL